MRGASSWRRRASLWTGTCRTSACARGTGEARCFPVGGDVRNANVALRQELDLFANVRPCRRYAGVPSVYGDVDLVVVRETIEDTYTGVEFEVGTAEVERLIAFI